MLVAAGSAATPVLGQEVQDDDGASGPDTPQKIDLGVKPAIMAYGAVVVPRSPLTFVAFNATSKKGEGMALVELSGCADWKFRISGDEEFSKHEVILDDLGVCDTFEVTQSTWAVDWAKVNADSPLLKAEEAAPKRGRKRAGKRAAKRRKRPEPKTVPLRHFAFTFLGVDPGVCDGGQNFECLATGIRAELLPFGPFEDVVAYIDFVTGAYQDPI